MDGLVIEDDYHSEFSSAPNQLALVHLMRPGAHHRHLPGYRVRGAEAGPVIDAAVAALAEVIRGGLTR